MKKRLGIIWIVGLLLFIYGCVAEVRPGGYYGYRYHHDYPSSGFFYYDSGYPYGHGSYYRYRH